MSTSDLGQAAVTSGDEPTEALTEVESFIGSFDVRTEVDTFALNLTAGETYRIDVAPVDGSATSTYDPAIQDILAPDGTSLGLSDTNSGIGYAAMTVFTADVTGTYSLKTALQSPQSTLGNYKVTVSTLTVPADDYVASTDTTASLALGGEVSGVIETAGDVDYIAVTLEKGTAYSITLTGEDKGVLGDLEIPIVSAFLDANGQAVAANSYTLLPGYTGNQIDFTPAESGTYYVAVAAEGEDTGDYYVHVSEQGRGVNSFQQVHTVAKTGDNNIDAFLDFPKAWGSGVAGETTTVTFSFPTATSEFSQQLYGINAEHTVGFSPVSATEAETFRGFLQHVSDITNLNFVEVPDTGTQAGTIRLAWSDLQVWAGTRPAFGWAHLPDEGTWGGDMWLNRSMHTSSGGINQTILHELGHALGLSHSNRAESLDAQYSGHEYSLMTSFKASAEFPTAVRSDLSAQTFMWLDIQALIHMYGKGDATNGDDSFTYDTASRYFQTIWDAGGTDEIIITGTTAAVIDLTPGTWQDVGTSLGFFGSDGARVGTREATVFLTPDTVIENVSGGSGNDRLTGNDVANEMRGNAGDDDISALSGNDLLTGGAGSDSLHGGGGDDALFAGPGDTSGDFMDGGNGNDTVGGGPGNDTLVGGTNSDIIFGGEGNDLINTGAFTDINQDGRASLNEFNFSDTALDVVWSGAGNDTITGDAGDDILGSGDGHDDIAGNGGQDILYGGKDTGADTLRGGDGNDTLYGAGGDDLLEGGNGHDLLFNGAGADTVSGGAGNDTLYAGPGDDTLIGGGGSDTFEIFEGNGADIITDFEPAGDSLILNALEGISSTDELAAAVSTGEKNGQTGLIISLGGNDSLFLTGLGANDLDQLTVIFM